MDWTSMLTLHQSLGNGSSRLLTLAKKEGRIQERFDIDRDNWRESFLLYERDLAIQKDLEYLTEAVFVFYTKHLDKFIRENDKL